ncbi:uncharacterized protein [Struthio camelus]|uniref:uncharacterized protein n=1 Tax=Struthio camelus TaxID=8801 RepID=UPI0036042EC2
MTGLQRREGDCGGVEDLGGKNKACACQRLTRREGHDEPPILIHQGPRKRETEIRVRYREPTSGCAAAKSLRLLKQFACWEKGEWNITSEILDELSQDVISVRHEVLQNRAAIDFLLLAHGHGCEEFEE